jgi:hypothetical protein
MEYLKLVEEYYNFKINIRGWGYSPGIADLPIPPNATLNKEFVEKAVSILRKYAGCDVPLVANFKEFRGFNTNPLFVLPFEPSCPSLSYLILIFVIIPIAILLPIVLILRKANNKKNK